MSGGSRIEHISDTARWVALYRALESDRADAHFRDPYARRLLGEDGEAVARSVPAFRSGQWPMVVRTCLFDEEIVRAVEREGADMVVNLAAGLDARPWRMRLPAGLSWVDVDLGGILDYKTRALAADAPACRYEAAACDLRDAAARRALLERLGKACSKSVVLTEGLLIYLPAQDVSDLAEDLHASASFRWWIVDLASPRLLKFLQKRWGDALVKGQAPLRFAPAEGTEFFRKHGWKEAGFRSVWEEGKRLNRRMRGAWLLDLLTLVSPPARREEGRRMSGVVRLERV